MKYQQSNFCSKKQLANTLSVNQKKAINFANLIIFSVWFGIKVFHQLLWNQFLCLYAIILKLSDFIFSFRKIKVNF